MTVSPTPQIDPAALQSYAENYGPSAQNFASQNGMVFNPYTSTFETDPRLAFKYAQDPHYQAAVAEAQNEAKKASLLTPGEQMGYRGADNSIPGAGATYGDLISGGYKAVDPSQAQQATQSNNYLSQIQQLQTLATQLNPKGSNPMTGEIKKLMGKMGLDTNAQQYEALRAQLPASLQGSIPEIGSSYDTTNAAYSTLLHNLASQQASQSPVQQPAYNVPQPQQQAQSPVGAYSLGAIGGSPQSGIRDAYSSSAPGMSSPGQLGANAYAGQLGNGR